MGSIIAILLFSLSLITCLLLKFSVVYALVIGYIIFIIYGLIKRHIKTIDVGIMAGVYAFYLYFLPLWNLILGVIEERNKKSYKL